MDTTRYEQAVLWDVELHIQKIQYMVAFYYTNTNPFANPTQKTNFLCHSVGENWEFEN